MISSFRDFAKSRWAIGLLVLLALGLLVTGGSQMDVLGAIGPRDVISAGDRSVDQPTFARDFDRVKKSYEERAQRPLTIQELVAENIHLSYLTDATRRMGFLNWAWKVGIRPGKELVLKQIRQAPAFFNQVTGVFDEEQYRSVLAQQNATPAELEQEFRDQYATSHFGAALFAGARVPRIYGALVANQALESRDARWFTVTQAMAGVTAAPTDAQLTAFINQNAADLRRPELRVVSVVFFADAPDASVAIPEARIVERFNFHKDELSTPERRTFVLLTTPTRAAADRVAAALRAGKSPAEAGRAGGVQPVDYPETPRSAVSDPAVAAAVFGLAAGQVSDPVQGRLGFTVAQVASITPGQPATLESARAQILEELRADDAKGRTFARVTAYEEARKAGKSLEEAAAQVGARMRQLPAFTEQGVTKDGQLNAPPQLFTTAWALSKGGESELVDVGGGQYFVLRVDQVIPPSVPPLEEVRAELTPRWIQIENNRRLVTKAEELAGRVRAGEDIAVVARSVNASLTTRPGIQRNQETQEALGQGVLQGVFGQGRGQVFNAPISATEIAVGRVDQIHAPTPVLAAPIAERVRPRMTQDLVQSIGDVAVQAGADRSRARYDVALARQALGLPAEDAAPATPAR